MSQNDTSRQRISIPNIPIGAVSWYLAAFTVITVYLTGTNTLFILATEKIIGWQAIQYVVTGETLKAGGVALIASPIIVEVGRMVLAEIWTERRLRKARAEGRKEGRAEGTEIANRRWVEWNRRRKDAEAKGEPFTEPAPGDP